MDAMVSGRIPVEMKEQGAKILAEIGATQSQLIKAAYEYLLAEGRLPQAPQQLSGSAGLSDRDLKELEDFINNSTVQVNPEFWEGFDYKEAIAEGRRADYETLA